MTPGRHPPTEATELRESVMALARRMRRHRLDTDLTLAQMQVLGEVSRAGVITPAELGARLQVRVQSLTEAINALAAGALLSRRGDPDDRRRQLLEPTAAGLALLASDRAQRDTWLHDTMRDHLSELETGLLMLAAPVLRKLADAEQAQSSP